MLIVFCAVQLSQPRFQDCLDGTQMEGDGQQQGSDHFAVPAQLNSYTLCPCCVEDTNVEFVPTQHVKERLAAAGLGGKRVKFRGRYHDIS